MAPLKFPNRVWEITGKTIIDRGGKMVAVDTWSSREATREDVLRRAAVDAAFLAAKAFH